MRAGLDELQGMQRDWMDDFEKILNKHEIYISGFYEQDGKYYFELEMTTPNGGDEVFTVWQEDLDVTTDRDGYAISRSIEDYDTFVDDYVDLHLHQKGAPHAEDLVEDAKWIIETRQKCDEESMSRFLKEYPFNDFFDLTKDKGVER